MKRGCLITVAAVILIVTPRLRAVEKQYQTGKIISVQQKARTRVLYYLVNTPVTQDDPYYEVSVQVKDTVYMGEYTPFHSSETLPADWKPDASVQARLDKRHIFLKRPDGGEVDLIVVKRIAVQSAPKASDPTPAGK